MTVTKTPILLAHCWQIRGGHAEILYDGEHVALVMGPPARGPGHIVLLFVRELFEITWLPCLYGILKGVGRTPNEGPIASVSGVIYHQSAGSHSFLAKFHGKRWSKKLRAALIAQARLDDQMYPALRRERLEEHDQRVADVEAEQERQAALGSLFDSSVRLSLTMAQGTTKPSGLTVVDTFRVSLILTEDQVRKIAEVL